MGKYNILLEITLTYQRCSLEKVKSIEKGVKIFCRLDVLKFSSVEKNI